MRVSMISKMFLTMCFSFVLTMTINAQNDTLFSSIKTVVIDPGHGGKDPGCHGASTNEKDVALAVGKALGKRISEKYPHIKVIYTRKTDVFVELADRAKIANDNNADLFICIHANSGPEAAHGAETYVLGLHKSDAQRKVAERENSIIHLEEDGGAKYKEDEMTVEKIIARTYQLKIFLDMSIMFADKIQNQFEDLGRHNRGIKQAGFLVLYRTTMPSVLIETGFLTNKEEEAFLKDSTKQDAMAEGIFKAFEEYKKELDAVNVAPDDTQTDSQKTEEVKSIKTDTLVFTVQLLTSAKKLDGGNEEFKGVGVYEYFDNGLYKYTSGQFASLEEASTYKKKLLKMGFESPFILAFLNGKRINLNKAVKLAGN